MSGGSLHRVLATIVALVVALGCAPAVSAGVGTPLKTCFRPAQPGDRAAAILAASRGFDCTRAQRDGGPGDFWILSEPLPMVGRDLAVRTISMWQRAETLYILYADGTIRSTGFTSATAWRYLALGAIFQVPLPDAPTRPVRLLWHVEGAVNIRAVVLDPRLATMDQILRADLMLATFYAGFGGLAVALLALNTALSLALRQRFHPPYCMMLLFLIGFILTSSGLLGQWAAMDNNLRMRLNTLMMAGSVTSAMIFARRFLDPTIVGGRTGRAISVALVVLLSTNALFVLLMPWQAIVLDRLASSAFAATLALTVPLLWRGWRSRDRYARAFTIAWGLPLLTAGARIAQALRLLDWSFWIDHSALMAMMLEAAGSGMAIAWRIKQLGEERDTAREREMLARLQADSDPLTGLLNRRSFLREAIGRRERHLLVLADIDHFKKVNDTLGHDGGDQVLRVFADALRRAVPPDALVARIGGEEFAVLVPVERSGDAMALPETILTTIRTAAMPFDLTVTASLGSGCATIVDETEWKRLYRRADDALFSAKRAGRDRLRWAEAA